MPDLTPIDEDEYGELVIDPDAPDGDLEPAVSARRIEWEDSPPAPEVLHLENYFETEGLA